MKSTTTPHPRCRPAHAFLALAATLSSGACSNSCGLQPLPAGFDEAHRMEGVGAFRMTPSGLAFLGQNLGTLWTQWHGAPTLTAPIPTSSGSSVGMDYMICPGGPDATTSPPKCQAELDLSQVQATLATAPPHNVKVTGTIAFRVENLPLHVKALCVFGFCAIDTDAVASINGDGACPGGAYNPLPIQADIAIAVDANTDDLARHGYSAVSVLQVLDGSAAQSNIQNHINVCGGVLGSTLDAVKGLVTGTVLPIVQGALAAEMEAQICVKPDPDCPAGSQESGGYCRVPSNACVTRLLGVEGRLTAGQWIQAFPPGAAGSVDVLIAAGGLSDDPDQPGRARGDLNPVGGGAALGLVGGAEATEHSPCAMPTELFPPTGFAVPSEVYADTVPDWPAGLPGPHFHMALSERYLNYLLNAAYQAGHFCMDFPSPDFPYPDLEVLAPLIPSVVDLVNQQESQVVALQVRSDRPPSLVLGNGTDFHTDPNVRVSWRNVTTDFYVVLDGRYTRVFSVTQDLDLPLMLTVAHDAVVPVADSPIGSNPVLSNVSVLVDVPPSVAEPLASLVRVLFAGMLGERLRPIPSDVMFNSMAPAGVEARLPETAPVQGSAGVRKVQKGTDNFLLFSGFYQMPAGTLADGGVLPPAGTTAEPTFPGTPAGLVTPPAVLPVMALLVALLAVLAARKQRWAFGAVGVLAVAGALLVPGCKQPSSKGDDAGASTVDAAVPAPDAGTGTDGSVPGDAGVPPADAGVPPADASVPPADASVPPADASVAPADAGLPPADAGVLPADAGTVEADASTVPVDAGPPPTVLQPGLVGAYASAVVTGGKLWIAAYAERDPAAGLPWGDLVVGTWNGTGVDWTAVDGVPATPAVDPRAYDVNGFRGGQTAPGDDVGMHTSMTVDSAGNPAVAYYDRTHGTPKLARYNGTTWTTSVVEQTAGTDLGRFVNVKTAGGRWSVAYQSRTVSGGGTRAALRLATAVEVADAPLTWTYEDVAVDESAPCAPTLCQGAFACTTDDQQCTAVLPASSCLVDCGSRACVQRGAEALCVAVNRRERKEVPQALGSGIALQVLADGSPAIAFHDAAAGTLNVARKSNGTWSVLRVDGGGGANVGMSPSLAVDGNGDWHVAYQDVKHHQLRYVALTGGTTPGTPQVIDSGDGSAGILAFPPHWVGADASLVVESGGGLRVAYQDATTGRLRHALGTSTDQGMRWLVQEITQPGWAGAFPQVVTDAGTVKIVNWVRSGVGAQATGKVAVAVP